MMGSPIHGNFHVKPQFLDLLPSKTSNLETFRSREGGHDHEDEDEDEEEREGP